MLNKNGMRGIRPERLTVNRKIGIDLRREYSSMYSLRWEIERTFSIMGKISGIQGTGPMTLQSV